MEPTTYPVPWVNDTNEPYDHYDTYSVYSGLCVKFYHHFRCIFSIEPPSNIYQQRTSTRSITTTYKDCKGRILPTKDDIVIVYESNIEQFQFCYIARVIKKTKKSLEVDVLIYLKASKPPSNLRMTFETRQCLIMYRRDNPDEKVKCLFKDGFNLSCEPRTNVFRDTRIMGCGTLYNISKEAMKEYDTRYEDYELGRKDDEDETGRHMYKLS